MASPGWGMHRRYFFLLSECMDGQGSFDVSGSLNEVDVM